MRHALLRSKLMMGLVFGASFACAAAGTLPLDAGTYVVSSYKPCQEAPLAGVTAFDGSSFTGPHDSDCTTAILEKHGPKYRVEVSCKALGDGTPAQPHSFVEDVRIKSRTEFVITTHQAVELEFALCPAFH